MSENKATLVVTAIPNPEAAQDMQAYTTGVMPLLMKQGGELVYRGKINTAIKGDIEFGVLLIMSFASQQVIEEIFASAEYQALIPFRDTAFKKITILISSSM